MTDYESMALFNATQFAYDHETNAGCCSACGVEVIFSVPAPRAWVCLECDGKENEE
jgi:hypothetical protein